MSLKEENAKLRAENERLQERNKFLERLHTLDLADCIRLRRQVDFLMESQGLKKEEPKEEILDDQ